MKKDAALAQRSAKNWLITVAVFAAMAALTLSVWQQQVRHQHFLLSQRTDDVCAQAGRRLEVFMESHLRVASIFAIRWSTHETRDFSKKRFEEFSSILLQRIPGYCALGLIAADMKECWVAPPEAPISKVVLDPKHRHVLEEVRRSEQTTLSAPLEYVRGATTVYAVLPLQRGEEFLGYLVVDFSAEALINDCFHSRIRSKYHFIVRDGEQLIFRSSPAASEEDFAKAPARASVTLRIRNRTWNLEMIPRKEKAAAYGRIASLPLPLFGIFMSIGLSWLVFLLLRRMDMFRAARDQQVLLAQKVLLAQEEERARISRELHDELGQVLTALRLEMGWLEKSISAAQQDEAGVLRNIVALVEQATDELRRMCGGLRPPLLDDLGIEPAVRLLVDEFAELTKLDVDLDLALDGTNGSVSKEVALCTYRILQESLTNINRHAKATKVEVKLTATSEMLTLSVTDNGEGFDIGNLGELRGWGLEGMRERANLLGGTLVIRSTPGHGTKIVFRVPVRSQREEKSL